MVTVSTMTNEQLVDELERRVEGLYRINAELAAQCDRQGKVVDAAVELVSELRTTTAWTPRESALEFAVREYQRQVAELGKGGMR